MIRPDQTVAFPDVPGHIHFVGIGGSGMSGIASMFVERGYSVSGSDRAESDAVKALRKKGVNVFIGHNADYVTDASTLVVTSALWTDNPEYVFAKTHGIPVVHRSGALEWISRGKNIISVAGAHGKTTSTGMVVTALRELGEDPNFVNGGVIADYNASSHSSKSDVFVLEADESDGSFLLYDTQVALVTNVDPDHLDYYGSLEAFHDAFVTFGAQAKKGVVLSADDAGTQRLGEKLAQIHSRQALMTFGFESKADVHISNVQLADHACCILTYRGVEQVMSLQVPGVHNLINAAGACGVLLQMGYEFIDIVPALERFGGTHRRFERHAIIRNVSVYDDYAHHPSEVKALLDSARTVVGKGRLIAVHQPHLYSRTRFFAKEFAQVLEQLADHTVVLEVCGAREDPEPGITGQIVVDEFVDSDRAVFIDSWQKAADYLAQYAQEDDFIITMGCGDVYLMIPQIVAALSDAERECG